MQGITYLDALASFGKMGPKDEEVSWKMETLLDEMAWCGIHGALVYHNVAREYDPAYGNRMLMEAISGNPRLFPCWVVLPHDCGEMPPPKRLVKDMLAAGVRAVRMAPRSQNYLLEEYVCGELLDALAGEQILLSIGIDQTSYGDLFQIASRRPGLPILMTGCSWAATRNILPLMDKCPNVHIEFSTFQANYALEEFTERYGAERLLFGTDALLKSMGAAKSFVDYAELGESDRKLIAGGNLARLLRLERLPEEYPARTDGPILSRVKEGLPLEHITVIDSHAHMSHNDARGVGYMPMPRSDAKHMIRRNRRLGIDKVAISSWMGIFADCEEGNVILKDAMDQFPDDIIGYATLDPNYLTAEEFDRWMGVAHEEWGFKGMKPYNPRVRIPYNSPRYDQWYTYGNEHRLFCLLHSSGGNFINEVADISKRYPEISFLLAHSAGDYPTARERLPLVKERDNVYLEITLTPVTYRIIEYMVKHVGAEKVLFGTDAPMRDPIPQFGWMCYSRCSEEELELMLGRNMERILARCR